MKKQTVMWTALPNGFVAEASRLRLSVFVSPRLMTNEGMPKPALSQFPDFQDWASKAVSFGVRFNGGAPVAATVVSAAPSPALWQSLFKSTTYVRPYEFPPLDTRRVHSFPVRNVMAFLKGNYTALAEQVGREKENDYPHVRELAERFGQIATYQDPIRNPTHNLPTKEQQLQTELNKILEKSQAVPPQSGNPALDFYLVKNFYKPRSAERLAVPVPDLDFHQVVSSLSDYPEILRRMGLVIDLEVPYAPALPTNGYVQIEPSWSPSLGATTNITPRTHYILIGLSQRFYPAPRPTGTELENGMLKLSDPQFGVEQTDVDGSALKAIDFANNLLRAQSTLHRSADTPDRYSVPALRSGGLSLVKTGRALNLVAMLKLSKQKNLAAEAGSSDVDLYAEDVNMGYRMDIWDDRSGEWRSLHRRQGVYQFTDGGILVSAEDEGTTTMGVSQSADGSTPDLFLHETMVNWQGWSLSAPRYGKMVNNEDAAETPPTAASPEFGLATTFNPVPRSLPRLRFGASYRMRARAVDLAGNSLPHTVTEDAQATEAAMYTRMEPVTSPMTLLKAPTTQGESVERMVIRSNYDTPAGGVAERHVAPPRTSQLFAETHGLFDAGVENGLDKAAYATIIAREGLFNPDGIQADAQLSLPYLPDPMARGAALRGLPGTAPGAFTRIPFGNAWPDRLPFRMVVEEGSGAPSFDAESRVLTVRLPKAEMVRVRLSSYMGEGDLGIMGLWRWLVEAGLPAAQMTALRSLALRGGHWMLSPHRNVMLVHAVQQPLLIPAYQALKSERGLGHTHTILTDTVQVEGKSTEKLDMMAAWNEPIDLLSEPTWRTIAGNAHAGEVPVLYGATGAPMNIKQEFGDTKYRRVQYSAVATSRYKEYFQQPATASVTLTGAAAKSLGDHTPIVKGSAKVMAGSVVCRADQDYTIDHEAGTIARVDGGAIADGATVDVEYAYLPGPVTRETAAPTEVDVLNSARPAAPKVLYVVPTFRWSQEELMEGAGSVAVRRAGGLRVYMERPWFSSGEGELLGAVLWIQPKGPVIKAPPKSPPEALKPFVTQWGMDPIWLSNAAYAVPTTAHFPQAVATASGLTLEEVQGTTVAVAGHKVGFDEKRKLWYCDMEIDAGHSYWPFVRLALARYQPKSIANAHLSRVVLADYAQLAPDRLATVVFDPDMPEAVAVTVCGPGYRQSQVGRISSEIEVTVETRTPNVGEDLGWVAASSTAYPLRLTEDDGDDFTWSGGVTLPTDRGQKPYRLVIREYERFLADGLSQNFTTAAFVNPTARRLVYAAVLEI